MEDNSKRRLHFILFFIALYLVPLVAILVYAHSVLSVDERWVLFSIGLTSSMAGVLVITLVTRRWAIFNDIVFANEQIGDRHEGGRKLLFLQGEMTELNETLVQRKEKIDKLHLELDDERRSHAKLLEENKEAKATIEELQEKIAYLETETGEKLKGKERLMEEYLQTISDQREVIEKRQRQVSNFETKINDLQYELRMLLDLNNSSAYEAPKEKEPESAKPPHTPIPATPHPNEILESQLIQNQSIALPIPQEKEVKEELKRCLNMAQKVTGARHLNEPSVRFQKLSEEGYSLDLRRLCDSLNSETKHLVILYSRKEDKLIFCNDTVKELLGWSPEKCVHHFYDLLLDGYDEWHEALRKLVPSDLSKVKLTIQSRSGEAIGFNCYLGMIPTGLFKLHVIAVAVPI